jgi:hypothetical protein
MKTLSPLSLFLLATLSAPTLADTPVKATPSDVCPLVGPLAETTEDCAALRSAYQAEISECMDKMHAAADASAGRRTDATSHTSRSRFLICDKSLREKMAHLVN